MAEVIVKLDRISVSLAGRPIFTDLTWEIQRNQRIGLIGPNGAGKSTLMKLVAQELSPDAGAVFRLSGLQWGRLEQEPQLQTLDEVWQYHQLRLSDTMWARSEYLLGQEAADPSLVTRQAYSPIPGPSGALVPLTTSWAWAVTTSDPIRQELAADLILFLTASDNLANWSRSSQVLPARRSAMALLAEQNPYYEFLNRESETAQPMPVSETGRLLDVLGDAVFQALTTEVSPVLIAEQAAIALRQ